MQHWKRMKNNIMAKVLGALGSGQWSQLVKKEEGQGLIEYALILVLIAVIVIGVLTVLGKKVSNVFSNINSSFP
jgi:pilus assembly protein Flp/PilA